MKVYFFTTLISVLILFCISDLANAQSRNNTQGGAKLNLTQSKEELRDLIDAYASLGDEKRISEQMELFTPDALYKVYMNGSIVADVSGKENLEKEFTMHASQVKTYFTMNGQHTVRIDRNLASGISFSQIKMVRDSEEKNTITDYSVRYEDKYILQKGKWLIKERTAYFVIVEARALPR